MARKAPPLSSFAPELKQAWVEASTRRVVIELPNRSAATSLRHRLYKLRVALHEAGDDLYQTAQFSTIRIEPAAGDRYAVVMEPADSLYKEALSKAGVSLDDSIPSLDFELEPDSNEDH